jgi:2-iminobutanoate/2-iminopropanoate deaminase
MPKQVIHTDSAPKAIGPYSQAIEAHGLIFISGQIPIDPATGDLVTGDITTQTQQVMRNLQAILSAVGLSLNAVVRTTVYLTNIADFQAFNAAYAAFFEHDPPARATVEVSALAKGAAVEIDAIAVRPD